MGLLIIGLFFFFSVDAAQVFNLFINRWKCLYVGYMVYITVNVLLLENHFSAHAQCKSFFLPVPSVNQLLVYGQ